MTRLLATAKTVHNDGPIKKGEHTRQGSEVWENEDSSLHTKWGPCRRENLLSYRGRFGEATLRHYLGNVYHLDYSERERGYTARHTEPDSENLDVSGLEKDYKLKETEEK
jgi:hypothetical protein